MKISHLNVKPRKKGIVGFIVYPILTLKKYYINKLHSLIVTIEKKVDLLFPITNKEGFDTSIQRIKDTYHTQ